MATQQKQSMFCKVCYDAGKKEYTSHYVRDCIGGKVVCPTLLSQQCKYCKKHGHTPSHCPALEGKYKNPNREPQEPKAKRRGANEEDLRERARRLCGSPPPPVSLSENFPMIGQTDGGKLVRPVFMKLNVWASVVARPQQQVSKRSQAPEPEENQAKVFKEQTPIAEVPIAEVPIVEVPIVEVPIAVKTEYVPEAYSGCWADM